MKLEVFEKDKNSIACDDDYGARIFIDDLKLLLEDDYEKKLIFKMMNGDQIVENLNLSRQVCDIIEDYIFNNLSQKELIENLERKNIPLFSFIIHLVARYQRLYNSLKRDFTSVMIYCDYEKFDKSFDNAVEIVKKYKLPSTICCDGVSLNEYKHILSNYDLEKLDALNIKIYYQIYNRAVSPSKLFEVATFICGKADEIKRYNLSPLEQVIYAYDIVKQRKYKKSEGSNLSRNLDSVIFGEYIVCLGYVNYFNALLKCLGYNALNIVDFKNEHCRSVVNICDPKYRLDGFYVFDPTYDCRKENSEDYLSQYNYFGVSIEEGSHSFHNNIEELLSYGFDEFIKIIEGQDSMDKSIIFSCLLKEIFVFSKNPNYKYFEEEMSNSGYLDEKVRVKLQSIYEEVMSKFLVRTIDFKILVKAVYFVRRIQYYNGVISKLSYESIKDEMIAKKLDGRRMELLEEGVDFNSVLFRLCFYEERLEEKLLKTEDSIGSSLPPGVELVRDEYNMRLLRVLKRGHDDRSIQR